VIFLFLQSFYSDNQKTTQFLYSHLYLTNFFLLFISKFIKIFFYVPKFYSISTVYRSPTAYLFANNRSFSIQNCTHYLLVVKKFNNMCVDKARLPVSHYFFIPLSFQGPALNHSQPLILISVQKIWGFLNQLRFHITVKH
jgi:hypothetical protein